VPWTIKQPGYSTVLTRVYAPDKIAIWWERLTTDERGKALQELIALRPDLIDTITWKRTD